MGDLYVRFLREAADMLKVPTGLTAIASDLYSIDIDAYENLVKKLAELRSSSSHPVLRGLIDGVLTPSMAVLERAGRPVH